MFGSVLAIIVSDNFVILEVEIFLPFKYELLMNSNIVHLE